MAKSSSKKLSQLPWACWGLVMAQLLVFQWEMQSMNVGIFAYVLEDYAFNWARFVEDPFLHFPTLISHTLLHADWHHVLSNVIFFLLFGPAIERKLGPLLFICGYFMWGAMSAVCQGLFSPFSNGAIGASGAVSGAAGAFFVLYPLKFPAHLMKRAFGGWIEHIPSFLFIGLYYINELYRGFMFLMPENLIEKITLIGHWAHIGGFAAGALSMIPFILKSEKRKIVLS